MRPSPDENLPEVVPDTSPQVLTGAEAYQRYAKEQAEAKYAVVYEGDATAPKYGYDPNQNQYSALGSNETAAASPAPAYTAGLVSGYSDPTLPGETQAKSEKDGRRICGLRRKVFFIVLVVVIVILVAAIGGGVGAAASKKKKQDATAAASLSEDDSSTSDEGGSADTSTRVTTTVTISEPTTTSSSESESSTPTTVPSSGGAEPGFELVAWSDADFQGKSIKLTKVGFVDLPFSSTSYKWHPNGAGCCVTFCRGKTVNVGWRCTDFERKQASSTFDRLFFGCGEDASEENSRCDR